ncbi:hypothetical protein [Streptomyces sp. NPDC006668]|uniref:hypothetical protein n=1 Tax=Streptomyces sp. NPDC006668 TaxID=3156903 RepID=UPI0033CEF4FE
MLGNWALPRRDLVWAPEVYDNGGGFTMHYTARDRASAVHRRRTVGLGGRTVPAGQGRAAGVPGDARRGDRRTVADRLTGPYSKSASPLITTDTLSRAVRGPGGQDVVTGPGGRDYLFFHGWSDRGRMMYRADLGFANGYPVVRGSKVRYQAENARVHHAGVRAAPDAWDGHVVGGIDHADSYVEFAVFAASAGTHTLAVRFANGSLDSPVPADHGLTVNSARAGAMHYQHTGWENWAVVETAERERQSEPMSSGQFRTIMSESLYIERLNIQDSIRGTRTIRVKV